MSAKGLKRGKTCELRVIGLRFIFYLIGRGQDASFPNLFEKRKFNGKTNAISDYLFALNLVIEIDNITL